MKMKIKIRKNEGDDWQEIDASRIKIGTSRGIFTVIERKEGVSLSVDGCLVIKPRGSNLIDLIEETP